MKTVGQRKQRAITFSASGVLLAEGARLNDEINRLPTGSATYIPKEVFRFKNHDKSNRQQHDYQTRGMALIAKMRPANAVNRSFPSWFAQICDSFSDSLMIGNLSYVHNPSQAPLHKSVSIRVFAAVPSLVHSSLPCTPSEAAK
jgi:hypothetical protein